MNLDKFPLDFDALQKGDFINSDYLAKTLVCEPETKEYNFKIMQLINQIEETLLVVCKQSGNGIQILTDEEAVFYTRKQNLAANRKKRKQLRRLQTSVDASNLSDDGKKRFITELTVIGAEVAAVSKVRKQFSMSGKQETIKPNFSKGAIVKISG